MLTLNTKVREKSANGVKGVIYGSHVLFSDLPYIGVGTWKAVKALGAFTLSSQPANLETVTIGAFVYTFKTTLTTASGDVKIGATLADTQANLVAAINGDETLIGSGYGSLTRPHPLVSASSFSSNIMTVTALVGGTAGNLIATTETVTTGGSWGAATLTGGLAASAADGIFAPTSDQYNVSSYDSISQSLWSSGLQSPSTAIAKRYANIASDYDQLGIYTAGQSKKKVLPDHFNAPYARISKANIVSLLKENPKVTLGFNFNAIHRIRALDSNKFVVQSTSETQFQVVQINADGTLTVGALFTDAQQSNEWDVVDATKIVTIRNTSAYQYEYRYLTVSGTTISLSTSNTFAVTGSGTSSNLNVCKIATGKAVMIYQNNTNTYGMRVLDVTGAATLGSEAIITPAIVTVSPFLCNYDTDKFAIFVSSGGTGQVFAANVTGTSIAVGSAYTSTVPWSLDTNTYFPNFDAIAINTTNVVFLASGSSAVGGLVDFMEQISFSGTTVSLVTTFQLKSTSTYNPNGMKIFNIAANTYAVYMNASSTLDSRYDANYIVIPFTVSGSTVTLSQAWKKKQDFSISTTWTDISRLMAKVGNYFVNLYTGAASSTQPVPVHSPCVVELYNHETLMGSVTTNYPFVDNVVSFDGVQAAEINDYNFYLKVKNTSAQTNQIRINNILVEMD